jgi:hypothetical protein
VKRNDIASNWPKEPHADSYSIATLLQTNHGDKGSHAVSPNKDSSSEVSPTPFVQSPNNPQSVQARAALTEPNQQTMQFSSSKALPNKHHKLPGLDDRTRSEICVSPSWDSGKRKREREREAKRIEKEKADLEKRIKKLELEKSRRNTNESRKEPRRLEKKQRLGRSSRASSVNGDMIRDTSGLPAFSGSTRRASLSSSIQGFFEQGERRRSVDTMMSTLSRNLPCSDTMRTMPRLSNALPERFGAAIPGDLFGESTEFSNFSQRAHSIRSLNSKTKSPNLRSSARLAQTANDSADSQDKCIKLENNGGMENCQPKIDISQRNTDVDRSSFTASLDLERRSKLKIAAKELRTPPGVGKQEESTIPPICHLTIPPSNSDRGEAVQRLKDMTSVNVRNRIFTTSNNQTATTLSSASSPVRGRQREHPYGTVHSINRQNCTKPKPSPLGGPAITVSDLEGAAAASGKESGLVAKHKVNSTEKTLSSLESFKNSESIARNASLSFGFSHQDMQGGHHDTQNQSAHPDNGELSKGLYKESERRAKYPKGQGIADGQDKKAIASVPLPSPSHPNTVYAEERSKRMMQSLQQPSAYAAENRTDAGDILSRSNNPRVSNSIEPDPGLTINQLINNDKRILPSSPRSVPKDHQLKGSTSLKHESSQCESGASNATEPLIASPLNTIYNVETTGVLLPVELSTHIRDESKVVQLKERETSTFDNSTKPSGKGLQQPQQPKALAKLFVICCHCKFWHDIPSELYAKLALPEKIASPKFQESSISMPNMKIYDEPWRTSRGEDASQSFTLQDWRRSALQTPFLLTRNSALVRCCWCEHGMSRSCCEGWTTIVYMHERHH